ncbi:hypothetical protein ONZ45_g12148 [Pleurotus djamor]|nr:hypothetical protein ONZ45_g12148 [Pleurotus djamor]
MLQMRRLVITSWVTLGVFVILCLFYYQRHAGTSSTQAALSLTPTFSTPNVSEPHNHDPIKPTEPPKVLIVTAFFPLTKSKHSLADYKSWLSSFLLQIRTPIYFYAPPNLGIDSLVKSLRTKTTFPIYINTTFEQAFDIPPLSGDGMRATYEEMHSKDREAFRHTPELYSIWNAKPYFLDEAVNHVDQTALAVPGGFDYAFWVDAGSFRGDHFYSDWPNAARVDQVFEEGSKHGGGQTGAVKKEDFIFFPLASVPSRGWKWWRESDGPVDFDFSEGSFFGGTPSAISWYRSTFYEQHDKYLSDGHFVGKDQTLINAIMFLHPERFISVWSEQPVTETLPSPPKAEDDIPALNPPATHMFVPPQSALPTYCGSQWYYYEFFLASFYERSQTLRMWSVLRDAEIDRKWWWQRGFSLPWRVLGVHRSTPLWERGVDESVCPLRETVSVEGVLKAQFGPGWHPRTL